MHKKSIQHILTLTLILFTFDLAAQQKADIWYDKPAKIWEETIPLGNGRLGMTPDGNIFNEKIVLNDITLWSGSKQDANNYEANKSLPLIRQLILDGKNDEAQELVNKNFVCLGPGSEGPKWGKFQTLGDLHLAFEYSGVSKNTQTEKYKRTLSLEEAIATTNYSLNGVNYKKEYFSSFDDDVNVIRITADKPGKLSLTISLKLKGKSSRCTASWITAQTARACNT